MRKLIIITILVSCLLVPGSFVLADEVTDDRQFSYLFHLYYDNGKLSVDKDYEFSYDIVAQTFNQGGVGMGAFRGEVINMLGQKAFEFKFDPTGGKINVRAPYAPDGKEVVFYDSKGVKLLTVSVSESSYCNDDGICQSERGENGSTCPNDCKGNNPVPAVGAGAGGVNGVFLAVAIVIVGAGVAYYVFRRIKSRNPQA